MKEVLERRSRFLKNQNHRQHPDQAFVLERTTGEAPDGQMVSGEAKWIGTFPSLVMTTMWDQLAAGIGAMNDTTDVFPLVLVSVQ